MTTSKRSTKLSAVEAVAGDRDLLKALMKEALQEVLEGEMTEFLGAEPGERTEARNGYRAGYYGRNLVTRIGTVAARSQRPCSSATRGARKRWSRRWRRCTCRVSPPGRSRP